MIIFRKFFVVSLLVAAGILSTSLQARSLHHVLGSSLYQRNLGVRLLDLRSQFLTEITEADGKLLARAYPNLVGLSLHDNNLQALSSGVFEGLTKLEVLFLSSNSLRSLPPTIFRRLHNLRELRLQSNELASLPEDVFMGLLALEKLNLSNNHLEILPASIFLGLGRLGQLSLANNRLVLPPQEIFRGLFALAELWLGGNQFKELPHTLFRGLRALELLDLNTNQLRELPDREIEGLARLKQLSLAGNQLTSLPKRMMRGLPNLQHLWLQINQLSQQEIDRIFAALPATGIRAEHQITLKQTPASVRCAICLEPVEGLGWGTACGHFFHLTELQDWLRYAQAAKCPLCKQDVFTGQIFSRP